MGSGARIVVFGGAGDVGSRAVERLAESDDVSLITVADRDPVGAERVAAQLRGSGPKVMSRVVDAMDHGGLVAVMANHDIAASAIGPFFKFEPRLVAAAVESGTHYTSVCDEWDATEEIFANYDGAAREKGCVVLSGLGTSPGFTNVGVRYLADKLDSVERVEVSVYQPLDAGGGEAVIRHMLHIMTGPVASWQGGAAVDIQACSRSRVVEFPHFGPIRLWNMGHAEPVTIPKYFPGVRDVTFFMGYGRGAHLFVQPARLGLFRSRRLVELAVRGLLKAERWISKPDAAPAEGAVRLDVWGKKDGQDVHHLCCGTGQMRDATGLSLAAGTLMVARGELVSEGGGVFAPEACLAPQPFIRELAEAGIHAYFDLAMTRPIT